MLAPFDGGLAESRARHTSIPPPPGAIALRGATLSVVAVSIGARRRLFEDLDLHVRRGAQVAVTGPAGAGKTVLLEAIAGIKRVHAGSIRWNGVELSQLPHHQREEWRRRTLGCVFRNAGLFPGLDVLDNVVLPATFGGWGASPEQRASAEELLDRAGVRVSARTEELTRAERARVAIVRALWPKPRAVVVDEPVAHLDARAAETTRRLLQQLCCEAEATLIVATRNRDLAETFESTYVIRAEKLVRFVR
jgi:putative ABC transport system ATP-binding protein